MSLFRTVEIDFDVHKCIENERRGFDESANAALRRLLKLPDRPKSTTVGITTSKRAWSDDGVILSHGTPVRFHYDRRRQSREGCIDDGKWTFGTITFDSPSAAASELAVTKKGEKTRLNGWLYFDVREPSGKWVSLDSLRRRKGSKLTAEQLGL